MNTASFLIVALIWAVNVAAVLVFVHIERTRRTSETAAQYEITDYRYIDGQWVRQ